MPWDPSQYLKFAGHRLRPAIDLLGRVNLDSPSIVYDLGAGAGNVTELLATRWPDARVIGVDNSEEMLQQAGERAANIEWEVGDIGLWAPKEPAELIFTNAALHWIGDHTDLFTRLMSSIAIGGVFAVQMPRNFGALSHTSISEAALNGPWRSKLKPLLRPTPVKLPSFYIDLLSPLANSLDVWETEYQQVLTGENPIKEWTKGTWLKPLLDALEEPERSEFENSYAEIVSKAYPKQSDGTTIFPFKRMFITAQR
ncbi:MAG: methyltransferase domain-containing protein [Chloroflexi bacterium]|jgi:trans-aconitate 2-methyltransferase|nr:methyltransferase domain-containing protein [Chloroflexota bacterium]MBT4943995.1 methyltransferase domain-containing protein [Chloroflexota bacterium]MBT5893817.1 methyltransferase domain-containing protein [Chloroflexota bacterium]MBT6706613.1 methyltransferase domain-containing protein [Chloroflexota bacterium]MBT7833427.1 methyltransferase domain-containing protein [Chloroflexota bacterium]